MNLGAVSSNQWINALRSPRSAGVPAIGATSGRDARPRLEADEPAPEVRPRRPDRFELTGSRPGGGPAGASGSAGPDGPGGPNRPPAAGAEPATAGPIGADGEPLDESERKQVEELAARDREVRTHEQAHKAAGGRYAGAISYSYRTGPDGRRYAVGGSVPIDASPVAGDPDATIAKMQVVRRAALAPAEPSAQDQRVAAQASRTEAEARAERGRTSLEGGTDADRTRSSESSAADRPDADRLDPGAPRRPEAAPSFALSRARTTYAAA